MSTRTPPPARVVVRLSPDGTRDALLQGFRPDDQGRSVVVTVDAHDPNHAALAEISAVTLDDPDNEDSAVFTVDYGAAPLVIIDRTATGLQGLELCHWHGINDRVGELPRLKVGTRATVYLGQIDAPDAQRWDAPVTEASDHVPSPHELGAWARRVIEEQQALVDTTQPTLDRELQRWETNARRVLNELVDELDAVFDTVDSFWDTYGYLPPFEDVHGDPHDSGPTVSTLRGALGRLRQLQQLDTLAGHAEELRLEAIRLPSEASTVRTLVEGRLSEIRYRADLVDWVSEHGSKLLQRQVDALTDGHGWFVPGAVAAAYENERLASELPGWHRNTHILKLEPVAAPTNAALDLLDNARAMHSDAELRFATTRRKGDDRRGFVAVVSPWLHTTEIVLPSPELASCFEPANNEGEVDPW